MLAKVTPISLHNTFKSKKQIPPTAQKKFKEKFPQFQFDWNKKYSLPFTVTIETEIREFQYKVLNNIVLTNERLFRQGLSDSPLCTFCKQEVESFEHIFFYYNVTKAFWEAFCSWLGECQVNSQTFTIMDIFFGVFDAEEDFIILNHLILTAKFYIYKCKLNSKNPSVRVYKAKIGKIYQVGMKIAAKRNKLAKQFQKWDKLLPHIGLWDGCRSNNAEQHRKSNFIVKHTILLYTTSMIL